MIVGGYFDIKGIVDGADGANGVAYSIVTNTEAWHKKSDGTYDPSALTWSYVITDGSESVKLDTPNSVIELGLTPKYQRSNGQLTELTGTAAFSLIIYDDTKYITIYLYKGDVVVAEKTVRIVYGISSVAQQYYLSNSSISMVGGTWGFDVPTKYPNTYIWVRTVTTYTDGSTSYTEGVCQTGSDAPRYNLYKNTDFLEVVTAWEEYPQTQVIVENITEMGGRNGFKKAWSSNNNGYVDLAVLTNGELDVNLKANTKYTLSFWAMGTCGSFLTIFFKTNAFYKEKNCVLNSTTEWQFFTQTVSIGDSIPNMTGFWRITSGELTICMPKLEEGDTATPWCLAQSETMAPRADMVKWSEVSSTYKFYAGKGSERKYSIVWYNGSWYSCTKSHTKRSTTPQYDVANSLGYWSAATPQAFVATDLLLSRRIVASEIETESMVLNQLLTSGDGATIKIQQGLMEVFGNNTLIPNIRFGVNDDGYAVMQYFDADGNFLYDLGPNGISSIEAREQKWITYHRKYLGTSESSVMSALGYIGVLYNDGSDVYKYVSKMVAGVVSYPAYDGLMYKSNGLSGEVPTGTALTGWYCTTAISGATSEMAMQYQGDTAPSDISTYNPTINVGSGYVVYFKKLEYYSNGKLTRTQNVYWSEAL